MSKCIRMTAPIDRRVIRVADGDAEKMVAAGEAEYVPHEVWKKSGRAWG